MPPALGSRAGYRPLCRLIPHEGGVPKLSPRLVDLTPERLRFLRLVNTKCLGARPEATCSTRLCASSAGALFRHPASSEPQPRAATMRSSTFRVARHLGRGHNGLRHDSHRPALLTFHLHPL